jgi:hypothetical protein
MANNDFLITDIVDQSAFDQLNRLEQRFEDLKTQFVAVSTAIGKGIGLPVSTIDDMSSKMEVFRRQQQELIRTQEELSAVENKYYDLLDKINDIMSQKIQSTKSETQATSALEKARERLALVESEEGKELAILKERTRQLNLENKANARLTIEMEKNNGQLAKSYNVLSAQYSKLKMEINSMSKEMRESEAGKEKIGEAKAIYEQMKRYQEETGKFSLNVGNYKNSILEALGVNGELASKIVEVAKSMNAQAIQIKASAAATKLDTLAKSRNIIVSKSATAAQAALNAVAMANPYVVLATAIAAVSAALLAFAKNSVEAARQQRIMGREVDKTVDSFKRMESESDLYVRIGEAAGKSAKEIRKMRYEAAAAANDAAYLALSEGRGKYLSGDMSKEDFDKLVQAEKDTWDRLKKVLDDNLVAEVAERNKANKTINTNAKDAAKEREQKASQEASAIADRYAFQAAAYTQAMNDEIKAEVTRYEQGEINKEQFEAKKAEIEQRYAEQSADLAVALIQEQLKVEGLSDNERIKLSQKLAEAQNNLNKLMTDNRIKAANDATEAAKKAAEEQEKLAKEAAEKEAEAHEQQLQKQKEYEQQRMELIQQSVQTMTALFSGIGKIISNAYDQQIKELEKSTDAQMSRIERLAELGAITTEEAEARKRAAEEATEAKREEIMKKQAAIEKAANIANTIMNTAVAVMKAWSQGGIFAAPMAALIAAQGAIQLATIMSTKAYAKGTDNAAGGLSIVGDGGRPEIVLSRGKAWLTPDTPTLVNLQRGDKVLPDAQAVLTGKLMSDYAMLSEQLKDKRDEGVTVNVTNDHNDLRKEMELSNEQLDDIKRILRKQAHNADYMRMYARV